jgi:hypothetical protein
MVRLQQEGKICYFEYKKDFFLELGTRESNDISCGNNGNKMMMDNQGKILCVR